MTKIYAQKAHEVFTYSGSLAVNGILSGSLPCAGYSKLVGWISTSASSESGSGFRIHQSIDNGLNWRITSSSAAMANSSSAACSVDIIGNAVQVYFKCGSTAGAASVNALFYLRPI